MIDDQEEDWGALESHITADGQFAPPTAKSTGPHAKTQRFPCEKCAGTGQYRGVRMHQAASECFACGSKGYFMTSAADRAKARVQRRESKARKLQTVRETFEEQNPGMTAYLAGAAQWSSFAAELLTKLNQYGALTDGQVRAVRSMQAKTEARKAERAAMPDDEAGPIGIGVILARERKALGLLQKDVAAALGCSITYVSDIERGARTFPVSRLRSLPALLRAAIGRRLITEYREKIAEVEDMVSAEGETR